VSRRQTRRTQVVCGEIRRLAASDDRGMCKLGLSTQTARRYHSRASSDSGSGVEYQTPRRKSAGQWPRIWPELALNSCANASRLISLYFVPQGARLGISVTFRLVSARNLLPGLLLIAGGSIAACGSSSASNASAPSGSGSTYSTGTGGTSSLTAQSIAFDPPDTVLLRPGESLIRNVVVSPASIFDVNLALLDSSADAALSQSVIQTSSEGVGSFTITGSSAPASFDVRASVGTISSKLSVSVSDIGYATVNVTGSYAGIRKASEWVASLHSGKSCAELGTQLPDDGALAVIGANSSQNLPPKLEIDNVPAVPVGLTQAVILRGDHLIWGCKNVPTLNSQDVLDLEVPLYDVPVSYGADPIHVVFDMVTNTDAWATELASVKTSISDAFVQSMDRDPTLLLESMKAHLQDSLQAAFDQRRSSGNWDEILSDDWNSLPGFADGCIRNALDHWLTDGAAKVSKGASIDTKLSLSAASVSLNQVQLSLLAMNGYDATELIAQTQVPMTATIDAKDALFATTHFSFNDGLLLRLLAQTSALSQFPDAKDLSDALSRLVQCDALGVQMNSAAPDDGQCDSSCLAQLCATALQSLWTNSDTAARTRNYSDLTMNCSGTLRLDGNSVVTGYDGTWVGLISSPAGNISTGGTLH
jgi:hypothetical protein